MRRKKVSVTLRHGEEEATHHAFNFAPCGELVINGKSLELAGIGLDAYQARTGHAPGTLNGREAAGRFIELLTGDASSPVCFACSMTRTAWRKLPSGKRPCLPYPGKPYRDFRGVLY